MEYLLVEWIAESKTYSVISSDKLSDGSLRRNCEKIVGNVVSILWKRNRGFSAVVLEIGIEQELTRKADELALLASENDEEKRPRRKRKGSKTPAVIASSSVPKRGRKIAAADSQREQLDSILNVVSTEPDDVAVSYENTSEDIDNDADHGTDDEKVQMLARIEHLEEENRILKASKIKYKERWEIWKTKCTELKKENSILRDKDESEVELYPGSSVLISRSNLVSVKMMSAHFNILARNLCRRIFTTEKLSSHSLFGKSCNANKTHNSLPEIDPNRRDAIINFVLKEQGLDGAAETVATIQDRQEFLKRKKAAKREITKSLSDFLREEQKRFNNRM